MTVPCKKLDNKGLVYAVPGRELLHGGTAGTQFAALQQQDIIPDAVYITEGKSLVTFKETEKDLYLRYAPERIAVVSESPRIIRVLGDPRIIEGDNYDTKSAADAGASWPLHRRNAADCSCRV